MTITPTASRRAAASLLVKMSIAQSVNSSTSVSVPAGISLPGIASAGRSAQTPSMRRRPAAPDRLLATVMFTDIVGSTGLAAEMGDRRWRHLVARHHATVRGALKRHGGREIDTAGDGFFATFEQPGRAIACALELTRSLRALGIEIRAGVNMGEVEVMGPKVGGIAVHVGSRVMSLASSGEVWVSGTVRDLMAGSDVRFEDRGVHQLKGVPGDWHLYSVDAPPSAEPSPEEAAEAPAERRSWLAAHQRLATLISLGVVVALVAALIVAWQGDGEGPALDLRGNSAVGIDASTNKPVAVVPVGDSPTAIAIGADTVWVISPANTLGAIDPATGSLTPIGLPGPPTGIAADAGSVWVTAGFGTSESGEGALLRYSARTRQREQPIPLRDGVRGVANRRRGRVGHERDREHRHADRPGDRRADRRSAGG